MYPSLVVTGVFRGLPRRRWGVSSVNGTTFGSASGGARDTVLITAATEAAEAAAAAATTPLRRLTRPRLFETVD